jgi:hypothetical protein
MPRSYDARRDNHRISELQKITERHDKLETTLTGLFDEIINKVFPEKIDGSPDFDKFEWSRAQDLEQMLRQFRDGGNRPQNVRPAVAPATPATPPAAPAGRPAVAPATPAAPRATPAATPAVAPATPAALPDDAPRESILQRFGRLLQS